MPTPNHYDTLELSPKASAEVIRAAYKSLMQRHHPDKSLVGSDSTPLASSIALAYEVLSDPERRKAYDQTLLNRQPDNTHSDRNAKHNQSSDLARIATPLSRKQWSSWYAPLLIVSIVCAGTGILVLSKKKAAGGTGSVDSAASMPRIEATPSNANTIAVTDVGQVRTISGFVTGLTVELNAEPSQSSAHHVLRIPNIGLRLSVSEPDRWTNRIQAQRSAIMQQMAVTLAAAPYLELIKPEGDLYVKRLIEEAVFVVTGLDPSSALPPSDRTKTSPQAVEAMLPLSFSIQ